MTASELTDYRRATGALLWAAGQTLPHLACGSAVLARHFRHALVSDLVRANLTIAAARRSRDLGLRFRPVRGPPCLYLYTDSSAVSLRSSAAQSGWAIFLGSAGGSTRPLSSSDVRTGVVGDLIAWSSHRQRRVTHSSFAAEAFSLLQGLHAALGVADVACLLLSGPGGAALPVHAFIDSRSLYDALTSSATTGSKEVRAAVANLHDHYRLGSLSSVSWLPGSHQLADGLTKPTGGRALRAAVSSGWLPLPRPSSPSPPRRAAPRLGRRRRRWWPPRRPTLGASDRRPASPPPPSSSRLSSRWPSGREYGLSARGAPLVLVEWVLDGGMGSTGECEMGPVSLGLIQHLIRT